MGSFEEDVARAEAELRTRNAETAKRQARVQAEDNSKKSRWISERKQIRREFITMMKRRNITPTPAFSKTYGGNRFFSGVSFWRLNHAEDAWAWSIVGDRSNPQGYHSYIGKDESSHGSLAIYTPTKHDALDAKAVRYVSDHRSLRIIQPDNDSTTGFGDEESLKIYRKTLALVASHLVSLGRSMIPGDQALPRDIFD